MQEKHDLAQSPMPLSEESDRSYPSSKFYAASSADKWFDEVV
jgi:hypothetical protein